MLGAKSSERQYDIEVVAKNGQTASQDKEK